MTRTTDRSRSAIFLGVLAVILIVVSTACTADERVVATNVPAHSTELSATTTVPDPAADRPLESERSTATTAGPPAPTASASTTLPANLARRTAEAPESPYAHLETDRHTDSTAPAPTTTAAAATDPETSGVPEELDPEEAGDAPATEPEPDARAEGDQLTSATVAANEATASSTTTERSPTTATTPVPTTTSPSTTNRTSPSTLPSYVVTAVPRTTSTTLWSRGPTTSTSPRTVGTTAPLFLPAPDRGTPNRVTTTTRRVTVPPRRTTTTTRRATTTSMAPTTTTTAPPTTTTTTTTTTTAPPTTIYRGALGSLDPDAPATGRAGALPPKLPASLAPLTGLPVTATNARGAIMAKIDNAGPARPQAGLDIADIVYEERVEGSATRFAAVFHSTGQGSVGPIRSARSTDIGLLGSFPNPAFVFSGANEEFRRLIAGQRIVDLGADVWGGYWRNDSRRAPYNLYAKLSGVWAKAPGITPKPHFAYRSPGSPVLASSGAKPAGAVTVAFGGNKVGYTWHASSRTWRRSQNGRAHNASSGARIAPENVVVQYVSYVATGLTDATGAAVPEARLVGSGSALVFTDGQVISARWSKPTLASITTFVDPSGKVIKLTPGRTWVELADPASATWSP